MWKSVIFVFLILALSSCDHNPRKVVKRRYKNGNPMVVRIYSDDEKDSLIYLHQEFDENGILMCEGQISHGWEKGKWIWYYKSGKIHSEREYDHGKYINEITGFYENGKIENDFIVKSEGCLVGHYDKCPPDSLCDCFTRVILYYSNGEMRENYGMDKGKINDTLIEYYFNGKKRFKGYYVNGIRNGTFSEWDSLGILTSLEYYSNDNLIKKIK